MKLDAGGVIKLDRFLNLHKPPIAVIYISLLLSSLLSLSATKTLDITFKHSEKLKPCDWEGKCLKWSEIHGSEYAMTVGRLCKLRKLSLNSTRRPDQVSA